MLAYAYDDSIFHTSCQRASHGDADEAWQPLPSWEPDRPSCLAGCICCFFQGDASDDCSRSNDILSAEKNVLYHKLINYQYKIDVIMSAIPVCIK